MSRFHFCVVSKNQQFKLTKNDIEDYAKQHLEHSITANFVENNTENITKIFNKELKDLRFSNSSDNDYFLILMHADVFLDLSHLINHILECSEKYDVMGLCGTEVLNISKTPLNWYTGSSDVPQKRWGCVTHGELGNQTSFFSQDRIETTDHSVGCIDGLCMIFNKKAVESGLEFDERLRFNCYDTQISLDALMNKKLQLGVIVEPSLQHYSVGRAILEQDFLIDEKVLREHFNF